MLFHICSSIRPSVHPSGCCFFFFFFFPQRISGPCENLGPGPAERPPLGPSEQHFLPREMRITRLPGAGDSVCKTAAPENTPWMDMSGLFGSVMMCCIVAPGRMLPVPATLWSLRLRGAGTSGSSMKGTVQGKQGLVSSMEQTCAQSYIPATGDPQTAWAARDLDGK